MPRHSLPTSPRRSLEASARIALGRLPLMLRLRPGPAAGARTPVYLASSPQVAEKTGGYFVNCKAARPSALAQDAQAAARLWAQRRPRRPRPDAEIADSGAAQGLVVTASGWAPSELPMMTVVPAFSNST
jgi:hypothetical protein